MENAKGIKLFVLAGLVMFGAGCAATLLSACASGQAVQSKITSTTNTPAAPYLIGRGDDLEVIVWKEQQVSGRVTVAGDGTITVPLAGQVKAAGLTTAQVQKQLTDDLKPYLGSPNVTVRVADPKSQVLYVLGEVQKPGTYSLRPGESLSQALAEAGGLTQFANPSSIRVSRRTPTRIEQLTINYDLVQSGKDPLADILLVAGDTIDVP